ncbi:MAG: TonB-dependent receptor [bacterium]|nr:TonB-dependent receptor [bacterium]
MRRILILTSIFALFAGPVLAGTTGDLKGIVSGDDGDPLPGATVTISSPALIGGARSTFSRADGSFGFPAIAPGLYLVKVELDGFVTREQTDVQVRLGRTTELRVELQSGSLSETITVTGDLVPVIDPEQVSVSQTFTVDYLQKASVGNFARSYQSVLGQAAGAGGPSTGIGANPNVFGSTIGENAWYVDGFNTTDPVTSTFSGNYAFDTIQEISIETAGFEAEFGGATGGVVNVVTKSGGNDLSGTADVRYFDSGYFESGDHFDPDAQSEKSLDPSATIGGPILRDELWFFAGFNPTETERTAPGSPTTRTFAGDFWLGKLSWQAAPHWLVVLKGTGDPTEIENSSFVDAQFRPPETQSLQEQGGEIYQVDVSAVLTDNLLWDLRLGASRRELNTVPMSGDIETPNQFNVTTGQFSVNYENAQFSDRDRDYLNTGLTWYIEDFLGSHELRGGFEYNDDYFNRQNFRTGDFQYTRRIVSDGDILRNFTHNPNRDVSEFDGTVTSYYLQDGWSITPDLTLKLGLRYDQAQFDGNLGERTADLDKLQPRLGLAWNMTGDGKTIGRVNWGRFMHPSALTTASFAERGVNESPVTVAWSCNYIRQFTFGLPADFPIACSTMAAILVDAFGWTTDIIQEPQGLDPEGWIVSSVTGGAGVPNVVDPNLDATFQDTFMIGVERQLFRRTSAELTYLQKDTEDIFEDTCNGAYADPQAGHACDFFIMANLPGLRREYEGAMLRVESRATDWMHLNSSLVWSESKGNVEYNQNAGSDYDFFPDHYDNRFGLLADHRRWRMKVNGFFELPLDFALGVDATWSSKSVVDHFESAENAGYGNHYLSPRGAIPGNENYQLDLQLNKYFRFGDSNLQLIAAMVNVFDSERPTDHCERDDGCLDVEGNDVDLGDPINWQRPRRYEVGVRFEF